MYGFKSTKMVVLFFLCYDFIMTTCKSELLSPKSKQAMSSDCAFHIIKHIIEVLLKLLKLIKDQLMHIIDHRAIL
jgi:hypothetical protein